MFILFSIKVVNYTDWILRIKSTLYLGISSACCDGLSTLCPSYWFANILHLCSWERLACNLFLLVSPLSFCYQSYANFIKHNRKSLLFFFLFATEFVWNWFTKSLTVWKKSLVKPCWHRITFVEKYCVLYYCTANCYPRDH